MTNSAIDLYGYASTISSQSASALFDTTLDYVRAWYGSIKPYVKDSLPVLAPAALAAAYMKNAAYGPAAFRLAFAAAFIGTGFCISENILTSLEVVTKGSDADFHISQIGGAFDIFFAVLFVLRLELPQMRVAFSALTAAGITAATTAAVHQLSNWLANVKYDATIDIAMSGITSAIAGCALTGWAFRYGGFRTLVVALCSIAIFKGNLQWYADDPLTLTVMRIAEIFLAVALSVGIPVEKDSPMQRDDGSSLQVGGAPSNRDNDNKSEQPEEPPQDLAA